MVDNNRVAGRRVSGRHLIGGPTAVTFALAPVRGGTRLRLTQEGVPNRDDAAKRSGWVSSYWEKMKKFLER